MSGRLQKQFADLLRDFTKRRVRCESRIWYGLKAKQSRICWSMYRNINTETFSPRQTLKFHSWLPSRMCRYREKAENQHFRGHLIDVRLLWLFTVHFIQYASCFYTPSEVHILQMYRDARPLYLHMKANAIWIKKEVNPCWNTNQFYKIFILISVFLERNMDLVLKTSL